jgi:hypothetical protein
MGMNLNNMAKMLRCAGNDDIITIKADDGSDTVTFMFESPSKFFVVSRGPGQNCWNRRPLSEQ